MPDFVSVQVQGLADCERRLKDFAAKVARRSVRKAVESGLVVLANAVRARVPVKTGLLKASLGGTVKTSGAEGAVLGVVGFGNEGYVARLVEFGHATAKRSAIGKRSSHPGPVVGHVPPHPFMRPAFDESKEAAIQKFEEVLKAEVEK